ncbi:class I SAM-dependent methyltransferase [Cupriavidus sp. L7L]|uniref:class I SAM-dependent methyltransferase n=1 Tax=Cupriavidus sp. L7L TaxID=2546443 RepID=UPI0010563D4C|nr:class I SAM-dependent methyltransferase [Cupriavidus sp. L7L]TDF67705.1 methyltransferase domain-containing protein [Cupriavidus sp. L7L]
MKMDMDAFYQAFEARFRGSREDIKTRQSIYMPLVTYTSPGKDSPALDIGCGRGEWLELMRDNCVPIIGVDLNAKFVEEGAKAGLEVVAGDGLSYLRGQPTGTFSLISAFHVVEHLEFEILISFLEEIFRTLKHGGSCLLETPNPMNVRVGINNFYLDPTHVRPLPSALLAFAAEYVGFDKVAVVRVNGGRGADQDFYEAPDYAVIAFKAPSEVADACLQEIEAAIGSPAQNAANGSRGDAVQLIEIALNAERQAHVAERNLLQTRAQLDIERAESRSLVAELKDLRAESQEQLAELQAEVQTGHALRLEIHNLGARLAAVHASTSWRITMPMRVTARIIRGLVRPRSSGSSLLKRGIRRLVPIVLAQRWLRPILNGIARRFPGPWDWLMRRVRAVISEEAPVTSVKQYLSEDALLFKAALTKRMTGKTNANGGRA